MQVSNGVNRGNVQLAFNPRSRRYEYNPNNDDGFGFWGALIGGAISAGTSIYAAKTQAKSAQKQQSAQLAAELRMAEQETNRLVEQQKLLDKQRALQAQQTAQASFQPLTAQNPAMGIAPSFYQQPTGFLPQKTTLQKATPYLLAGGIALPILFLLMRRK